jgi:DNA-binding MarR family transcriptional regulator
MSIEQGFAASPGYLLARLGAESRRLWARMLAEHDLTPHQFGLLTALATLGETYQQRLSGFVGIDPRNAVPVIDALRARDLIQRAADPSDRRRHLLRLSPAGARLVDQLRDSGTTIEDELLAALNARERATLHHLLRKLFDSLHPGST